MKFERDEIIGMTVAIVIAVCFFVAVRYEVWSFMRPDTREKESEVLQDAVVLQGNSDLSAVLAKAFSSSGKVEKLVVQDVKTGEGPRIEQGSRIAVHYVGMLANGTTFENTYEDGEPYRFTVGMGDVIKGWDQGLMGMQVGGERILVVPPELGYGARSLDGVPPNSTLLFSVELLSIE